MKISRKTSRKSFGLLALAGASAMLVALTAPGAAAETRSTGGVLAEYNGRTIDLSKDWEGATSCVEESDGDVRCYDSDADYLAEQGIDVSDTAVGTLDGTCGQGYLCLWDDRYYAGKKVHFSEVGKKKFLKDYGLEDKANSIFNNRVGPASPYDVGCGCTLGLGGREALNELSLEPHPTGSWNNKIDIVTLHKA